MFYDKVKNLLFVVLVEKWMYDINTFASYKFLLCKKAFNSQKVSSDY